MTPRRASSLLAAIAGILVLVVGCAPAEGPVPSFAVASVGPDRTVSPAVGLTRAALVDALGVHNLVLTDSQSPVRPAEAASLAAAPRAVYQVTLPKDPDKGYIVVYEFADPTLAAAAAAEQQAYLATGPGRVQTPQGTVTIIRQVGNTVVLYDWLPGASQDDAAPGIQAALETLGVGFPVPN